MASRRVPRSYLPQGSTGDSRLRPPADSLTGDTLEQRATLEPEPFRKLLIRRMFSSCWLHPILGLSVDDMTQHASRVNESHREAFGRQRCRRLPSVKAGTVQAEHRSIFYH